MSNLSQHDLPGTHWIGFLCLKFWHSGFGLMGNVLGAIVIVDFGALVFVLGPSSHSPISQTTYDLNMGYASQTKSA